MVNEMNADVNGNGRRECGAEVASRPDARRNAEDGCERYKILQKRLLPRGEVVHENGVFRLERCNGAYVAAPKFEVLRFDLQKKTVKTRRATPIFFGQFLPVYEQFIRQFSPALNGDRSVPKLQKELVKSVASEGILPMTGWC
ncbi:MAG: hypothetical protein ACXQT6_00310 [Candidatus Methanospirareceae archaeon]